MHAIPTYKRKCTIRLRIVDAVRCYFCMPIILISNFILAQNDNVHESYALNDALNYKKITTSLIINLTNFEYNRPPVAKLNLEGIGNLKKLKELIIFPVSEELYGPFNFVQNSDGDWVSAEPAYVTLPSSIPEEIGECQELQTIVANDVGLIRLPRNMIHLNKLHTLEIQGNKIPAYELLDILPSIKNLRLLNVFNCGLSTEEINALRIAMPDCHIVATLDELKKSPYSDSVPPQRIVMVSMKNHGIHFPNETRAKQFIRSLRSHIIEKYNVYYVALI